MKTKVEGCPSAYKPQQEDLAHFSNQPCRALFAGAWLESEPRFTGGSLGCFWPCTCCHSLPCTGVPATPLEAGAPLPLASESLAEGG